MARAVRSPCHSKGRGCRGSCRGSVAEERGDGTVRVERDERRGVGPLTTRPGPTAPGDETGDLRTLSLGSTDTGVRGWECPRVPVPLEVDRLRGLQVYRVVGGRSRWASSVGPRDTFEGRGEPEMKKGLRDSAEESVDEGWAEGRPSLVV